MLHQAETVSANDKFPVTAITENIPLDLEHNRQRSTLGDDANIQNNPRITEILLSGRADRSFDMILAMLAHLSQDNEPRWFTWISQSKPALLALKSARHYKFNEERIRFIQAKGDEEAKWLAWEALSNGTSKTVIADIRNLSDDARVHLEHAALEGDSEVIIIR